MATRIITDSAADFDLDTARRRKISVVPMTIQFGSATFQAGKNLSNDTFFQLLQEGKENPSTSQPAPAAFLRLFEEAKAAGDQVVAILLSGALSGTLQSAEIVLQPLHLLGDGGGGQAAVPQLAGQVDQDLDPGGGAAAVHDVNGLVIAHALGDLRALQGAAEGSAQERTRCAFSPSSTPWSTCAGAGGSAASRPAWAR